MSRIEFLASAKKNLRKTQYQEVQENLASNKLTPIRYIIENEWDVVDQAMLNLAQMGESDEVITQRMQDMNELYSNYMEYIELETI